MYNVSEYLEDCLRSIVEQTYDNLEILLIDDGSTDDSHAICERWLEKDKRITLQHQNNSGVSTARNRGLDHANGHYVVFVDADDMLEPCAIETYVKNMEACDAQLLIGEYKSNVPISRTEKYSDKVVEMSRNQAIVHLLLPRGMNGSVWAKTFVRSVIEENKIRFDAQIRYCEDVLFVYRYVQACTKIIYIPDELYLYVIRKESTMSQPVRSVNDKRLDICKVFKIISDEARAEGADYQKMAVSRYVYQTCRILPSLTRFESGSALVKKMKKEIRPYYMSFLADSTYSIKSRIASVCKYISPALMYKLSGDVGRAKHMHR